MLPNYSKIPALTFDALDRYLKLGIRPGDFLCAVLENNLRHAFAHADEENLAALYHLNSYLFNCVPAIAFGSEEDVASWLARGGEQRASIYDASEHSRIYRSIRPSLA